MPAETLVHLANGCLYWGLFTLFSVLRRQNGLWCSHHLPGWGSWLHFYSHTKGIFVPTFINKWSKVSSWAFLPSRAHVTAHPHILRFVGVFPKTPVRILTLPSGLAFLSSRLQPRSLFKRRLSLSSVTISCSNQSKKIDSCLCLGHDSWTPVAQCSKEWEQSWEHVRLFSCS